MSNRQVIAKVIANVAGVDMVELPTYPHKNQTNGPAYTQVPGCPALFRLNETEDELCASWGHLMLKWLITEDNAKLVSFRHHDGVVGIETDISPDGSIINLRWYNSKVHITFYGMPIESFVEVTEGAFKFAEPRGWFYAKPMTYAMGAEFDRLIRGVIGEGGYAPPSDPRTISSDRTVNLVRVSVWREDGKSFFSTTPNPVNLAVARDALETITATRF